MSPSSYMNTETQTKLSAFDYSYKGMCQVDKVDNMSDYTAVKGFCPLMGPSKSSV